MTYLSRLPGGTRKPDPAEVVRDALDAAEAVGMSDEVRAALIAVYGAEVVEAATVAEGAPSC